MIIATILLTNIPINKGDILQKSPLKLWNQGIEILEKMNFQYQEKLKNGTSKPEELEQQRKYNIKLEERKNWLLKLNRSGGSYIFSIVLLLSCFVSIIILSPLTLAITRQVLREMIDAKGFWTLLGGVTLNVFLALILCSFFYFILLCIASPCLWIMMDGLILILMKYTWAAYPIAVILSLILLYLNG